ncbi:MAG: tripartite tricarboxylate transporter substrate binding protein [Betaproteobacteria bacterium]|nr:tripartite tricarboxylate transporter substrate binding protein [Betaproteobacteria bacterium]MBI2292454.1 tripartite tricarboxylate transporter substrate binding protein [Betaproteobacteria bacterium]MBI3052452.1 tripartite tricarboxylate transporter substrate binding protein [Betaproteobacteria bacterium]
MTCSSILFAGALLTMSAPLLAQTAATGSAPAYPVKPVRLVVPFTPGGSTDIVARIIGQKLDEAWKQQVIIDNRPGAGGTVGVDFVAKSAPDGYTLVMGHVGTFGFGPSLYSRLPYDSVRDFMPITLFANVPNMLVVNPSLPVKSVKELIALAKSRPSELNYGSAGSGSAAHLTVEYFKLLSKTDITHIPYKGTSPMLTDLIAGQTSLTITGVPPLYPHVKSGRLRALGVASARRLSVLPELPTIAEAGVPGYEATTWFGPLAPAKTPKEIIARLNAELLKILQRPEVRKRLGADGAEPVGSTPEEFAEHIKTEIGRWAKVIKESGVHVE